MRYRIIYEKAPRNYASNSPDLPGCIATGDTLDECRRLMREAITLHPNALSEDGHTLPQPTDFDEQLPA